MSGSAAAPKDRYRLRPTQVDVSVVGPAMHCPCCQQSGALSHSRATLLLHQRATAGGRPSGYAGQVLPALRDPNGGPSMAVRLVALLVVLGLVVLTAPLFVVPVLRALL